MRTDNIKNELYDIKKWEEKIKRKDLIYKTNNHRYDFQQYDTIRSFGDNIYTAKININEAEMNQTNLLENFVEFIDSSRPKTAGGKNKKRLMKL